MAFSFLAPRSRAATAREISYEEAVENIKDAIKLHIADRVADGEEKLL
jgi:predicted RNase H-like HicB family nuclease